MYERFTDRSRRVMQLANQEACRFNHDHVDTEHILIGLVKEGSGVACNVLKNLDVDLRWVRLEVEKLVQSGPNMVTMGKLQLTARSAKVMHFANEEAKHLNHNYVGTEHLLLGLLHEWEGVAGQVLTNLGLTTGIVREAVLELIAPKPKQPPTLVEIEEQISNLVIRGTQLLKTFDDAMCNAYKTFSKQLTELHAQLTEMRQRQMTVGVAASKPTNEPQLPPPGTSWRDQPPMI